MPTRSGSYPIARRAGEIERLRIQAAAMEFDAGVMLDRIGVEPGWLCLDLGCGPGGILRLLSARVGSAGRVMGVDADPVMLEAARTWADANQLANVELVEADAYRTGLRDAFDLVHVRYLAGTAGRPDDLLREAIALARHGGVVAFEEPDTDTLVCHPSHPAWELLKTALQTAFASVGADTRLAKRLYRLFREAGLEDVRYRPSWWGSRAESRWPTTCRPRSSRSGRPCSTRGSARRATSMPPSPRAVATWPTPIPPPRAS